MLTMAQRAAVKDLKLDMLHRQLREIQSIMTVANYYDLVSRYESITNQIKRIENE